jgi:hypothetical protein
MNKACEEEYILSETQLLVLAAACGAEEMLGFRPDRAPSQNEALQAVNQLANSGLLQRGDDGLHMSAGISTLMGIIAKAGHTLVVCPVGEHGPQVCAFISDGNAAAATPYAYRAGYFRVFGLPLGSLPEELTTCGALPGFVDPSLPFIKGQDDAYKKLLSLSGLLSLNNPAPGEAAECVLCCADMYAAGTAVPAQRLVVFDAGISLCCACIKQESTDYMPYTAKTAEKWLEEATK